ncbi:hypothetical protein F3Y22_tig00009009pilonHSYRG00189 [Hibiscus syriacus]|uniref:Disease resistance protein At4g27190-like leucine-rich repeats domain-containing protein n=1 Tax=Hibiscus syriacus TaxID=106335 RepID=A0A6A3C7T1_HIBSY|nr:hypothetical protein F3Y22_tig00009009pilonHSYRG00189 [Hibiscus syriacus]
MGSTELLDPLHSRFYNLLLFFLQYLMVTVMLIFQRANNNSNFTFPNLHQLTLRWNAGMKDIISLPNLQTLEIGWSDFKEMVFQSEEGGEEKPALLLLSQITELWLSDLPELMHLWKEKEGFPNLRILHGCDGIKKLITHPTAKSLVQLKEMSISFCKNIEEIIQGRDDDDEISFSQLNRLKLKGLPKIESFCSSGNYTFSFPSLEDLVVDNCPKMMMFSQGHSNTPMLNKVQLQKWGGEEVHLEGSLNSTIQQLFKEKLCFLKCPVTITGCHVLFRIKTSAHYSHYSERVMIEECENSKEDQSKPSTSNTQVSVLFSGALGVLNFEQYRWLWRLRMLSRGQKWCYNE